MHRIFKIFCIIAVVLFGVFMTGCGKQEESDFQEVSLEELDGEGTSGEDEKTETDTEAEKSGTIFVHVCGAVESPGVYELDDGSRIYEVLEKAGGMTKFAADDAINQAEILSDGQQIYVPSKEETVAKNLEIGITSDGKVNINKASREELMTLSGVGKAKADAIIKYREEHGDFKSIEDIMEIEGIKEGVFHKIESQITVS